MIVRSFVLLFNFSVYKKFTQISEPIRLRITSHYATLSSVTFSGDRETYFRFITQKTHIFSIHFFRRCTIFISLILLSVHYLFIVFDVSNEMRAKKWNKLNVSNEFRRVPVGACSFHSPLLFIIIILLLSLHFIATSISRSCSSIRSFRRFIFPLPKL